jgi:hypothetical protein
MHHIKSPSDHRGAFNTSPALAKENAA